MPRNTNSDDEEDDGDMHYVHRSFIRPGQNVDSLIWNTYIKLLVDPFTEDDIEFRYSDEVEFHELIRDVWSNAGVDNDVTLCHEDELSVGTSAARGSIIDYRVHHDDGHRVGVEIKAAGLWAYEDVQDQLVRYAETGQVDSMLLLTSDPDMAEIDWPRHLTVPLFIVLLTGRRGRL
ncbi:hypothetical protein ACWDYH_15400 [Nocardia goodfellowii]